MDKKNIILVVIAVILFCVAVGVIISVMNDTDVQKEEYVEDTENLEEKINKKVNEIKRPTTEGIDDNVVEGILSDKNAETKNQVIGTEDGISSVEEELVYVGQNEANKNKDGINKEYTDFVVETDNEEETFSLSNYEGKPMVIMFWRSDVGEAIETLNTLNSAYDEYSESVNFVCIDVCVEEPATKQEIRDYLNDNDIKVDMYYDTNNAAIEAYNISFVPSVIFMDKNRNVINTKEGVLSYDTLEANLDLLTGNF